jgi:ketosteroid isomerase-like protein
MSEPEDFTTKTLERQRMASDAMVAGDPGPFMSMWSRRDPVSVFGAWGPCKTGWDDLSQAFQWVGSRFSDGKTSYPLEVIHAGTDLAYTAGYEHGQVSIDGGPPQPINMRVTHIYRLEDGEWKLVHRHADFAPADQSPAAHAFPVPKPFTSRALGRG